MDGWWKDVWIVDGCWMDSGQIVTWQNGRWVDGGWVVRWMVDEEYWMDKWMVNGW